MSKATTNVRENNTLLVLSEIMNNPKVSRAKISEITGLNKATVSEIVKKLMKDNYVIETGAGKSSSAGGRRPILLTINNIAGISVSFDVRYDRISYLFTYLDGEKIKYDFKEIEINKSNIIDVITETVDKSKPHFDSTPFGIVGVTVSIHGIVFDNIIQFTPYLNIDNLDLKETLEEKLELPVYIENEANLTALAESAFDSEHTNLISLSAHTGIGAGIVLDGKLYRGVRGRSGEIGHTVLYPNGLPCPCSNQGCLEQYCSPKAVLRRFQQIKSKPNLTFDELVAAYNQNDKDAVNLIMQFVKDFGIGLMNIIGNYDPEIVYINSEIVEEIPEIINLLKRYLSMTIYKDVRLQKSKLGIKSSLYGAMVLNLKEFFGIDTIDFTFDTENI